MALLLSNSSPESWSVVPSTRKGILYVRADNVAVKLQLSSVPLHCPFGASKYDANAPGKHSIELDVPDFEAVQRLDDWARAIAATQFPKAEYHSFLKETRLRCKIDLEAAQFWEGGQCVAMPELRGRGIRAVAMLTMWSTAGRAGRGGDRERRRRRRCGDCPVVTLLTAAYTIRWLAGPAVLVGAIGAG